MNGWLKDIRCEELPEQYRELAELIGLEAALCLEEHYRGLYIYFRSLDELTAAKKKEYIIRNFRGSNHAELARQTGYSLPYVYEILKKRQQQGQPALFPVETNS